MEKRQLIVDINAGGINKMYSDFSRYLINFKIVDGRLFMYNSYLKLENRNYIEIRKINNISVRTLIKNGLKAPDLLKPSELLKYGIDIRDGYYFNTDFIKNFNMLMDDPVCFNFWREHKVAPIAMVVSSRRFLRRRPTNNPLLDYASTSYKVMLNTLFNMSKSDSDKELFKGLMKDSRKLNKNFSNFNTHKTMAYLSSALLMCGDDYENVPEFIVDKFIRPPFNVSSSFSFVDDTDIEAKNAFVYDNGVVDPRKVIRAIRNAIAHSNFEVMDDKYIRVFNLGKKGSNVGDKCFNIYVPTRLILYVLYELNKFYTLHGLYPTVIKRFNEIENLTPDTIDEFLDCIEVKNINKIEFKYSGDKTIDDNLDEDLVMDIAGARNELSAPLYLNSNEEVFNKYIKKHLADDCRLETVIMDDELRDYIKRVIKATGEEYFYNEISRDTQEQIIAKIIKQKFNRKNTMFNQVLDSCILNQGMDLKSFKIGADSHITYIPQIELTLYSLLNSLFCFSFNHNKQELDLKTFRFPTNFYIDFYNSRRNIYDSNISMIKYLDTLITDGKKNGIDVSSYEKDRNKLINENNRLASDGVTVKPKSLETDIMDSLDIINEVETEDQLDLTNKKIFNRIRDSIAHNNISFGPIDINDIGSTLIYIKDIYKETLHFSGVITLRELLNTLKNNKVLNSMLNDNSHFKKFIKKK